MRKSFWVIVLTVLCIWTWSGGLQAQSIAPATSTQRSVDASNQAITPRVVANTNQQRNMPVLQQIEQQTGFFVERTVQAPRVARALPGDDPTLKTALEQWAVQLKQERDQSKALLKQMPQLPINPRFEDSRQLVEFKRLVPGRAPEYYVTNNAEGAQTISTDKVWPNGILGLALAGQQMVVGEWDGGAVRTSHEAFGGRAVMMDGATNLSDHATHVAGTLVGGIVNAAAKGMAYQANLHAYDWDNDEAEMALAAANGLLVSNHSYGLITGWAFGDFAGTGTSEWYWFGSQADTEDRAYGRYSQQSNRWDSIAQLAPNYLIVKAAGNDRGMGPAAGTPHRVWNGSAWTLSTTTREVAGGTTGYDCISHAGVAKNVLTVGAVNGIGGGYLQPSQVVASTFHGWGPTDDGRIKPDIVAKGVGVLSASSTGNTNYDTKSGTSMASPIVTGSLALIQQHYRQLSGNTPMKAATLKALVIQTADEAGMTPGPDYVYGWGLMNTAKAVQAISGANNQHRIIEAALPNASTYTYQVYSDGTQPLKVTVAWTDRAAPESPYVLDGATKALINDLDVRLVKDADNSLTLPWVMGGMASPSAAAVRADNDRDNVEQVLLNNPTPGNYTIRITHKGNLVGNQQAFGMIVSGVTQPQSMRQVTFKVDMTGQTVSPLGVRIAGSFQGWDPSATLMTNTSGNIWEYVTSLQAGTAIEYKFVNGNAWGQDEGQIPAACAVPGTSNRGLVVPNQDTVLAAILYGQCVTGSTGPVAITFRVDMTGLTVSGSGVHIAGSFQGWNPGSTPMTPVANNIWEYTTSLMPGTSVEYKFVNGTSWAEAENSIPFNCNASGGPAGNRILVIPSVATTLPAVLFDQCGTSAASLVSVTFRVDMRAEVIRPEGVHIAGNFQGWNPGASPMIPHPTQAGIYTFDTMLPVGFDVAWKFVNGNSWGYFDTITNMWVDWSENVPAACHATTGPDRFFTVPASNTVLPAFIYGSCNTAANRPLVVTFGNGIPAGWSQSGGSYAGGIVTPDPDAVFEYRGPATTPNNTVGSRGAYSGARGPIQSATASNGFVIFDSDFLDNAGTAGAFGTGVAPSPHYAELVSPVVDLSAISAPILRFHQFYRKFAGADGRPSATMVIFSRDGGATWGDTMYLNSQLPQNAATWSGDYQTLLLGSQLGGAAQARIKFVFWGDYYFWMLDDITLEAAPAVDVVVSNPIVRNNPLSAAQYGMVPLFAQQGTDFAFEVRNQGSQALNGVSGGVEVSIGGNTVYADGSALTSTLSFGQMDTLFLRQSAFVASQPGIYDVLMGTTGVNGDANPMNNNAGAILQITDTVYALDRGNYSFFGFLSTNSFTNLGSQDGMQFSSMYQIPSNGFRMRSATVLLAPGSTAGTSITFYVYDAANLSVPLHASGFHVITAADIAAGEVTLPLPNQVLNAGTYYLAVEAFTNAGASIFNVRDDIGLLQHPLASLIYLPGNASWFSNGNAFAVRLNGVDPNALPPAPPIYVAAPASNGATTGVRAPNGTAGHAFLRGIVYVSQQDVNAAGIAPGRRVLSLGLRMTNNSDTAVVGNIKIYMQPTPDTAYGLGTSWSTATSNMSLLYDGPLTIPANSNIWEVPMPQNFTHPGTAIYVAYEWQSAGPFISIPRIYAANSAVPASAATAASATGLPATLGLTAFRPEIRWGLERFARDYEVVSLFAKGQLPAILGNGEQVQALIKNNGAASGDIDVQFESYGANNFYHNQRVFVERDSTVLVNFPPLMANGRGTTNMNVNVYGDDFTFNNFKNWMQTVGDSVWAYNTDQTTGLAAVGYNTSSGLLLTKHWMTGGSTVARGVRVFISGNASNVGNTVSGVLTDSAGNILAQSSPAVLTTADLGAWKYFALPGNVHLQQGFPYMFGLQQTANATTGYFPLAYQNETPTRDEAYFTAPFAGGLPTRVNGFRFMIEAHTDQAPASLITFRVNMSRYPVDSLGVHLAGNFQGWNAGATPMTMTSPGIWEVQLAIPHNMRIEYKFINGNSWGRDETNWLMGCGADNGYGSANRVFEVDTNDAILPLVFFNSCATQLSELTIADVQYVPDYLYQGAANRQSRYKGDVVTVEGVVAAGASNSALSSTFKNGYIQMVIPSSPFFQYHAPAHNGVNVRLLSGALADTSLLVPGNRVRITGTVAEFANTNLANSETQIDLTSAGGIQLLAANDTVRVYNSNFWEFTYEDNGVPTQSVWGERFEGNYLRFENLEVLSVTEFTPGRFQLTLKDQFGNRMRTRDASRVMRAPIFSATDSTAPVFVQTGDIVNLKGFITEVVTAGVPEFLIAPWYVSDIEVQNIPQGYCASGATSGADTKIDSVQLGNMLVGSSPMNCETYTDNTWMGAVANIAKGVPFNMGIRNGTCGGFYPAKGLVFVDINRDFNFDPSEAFLSIDFNGNASQWFNGQLVLPPHADTGETRLRIVYVEGAATFADVQPCGPYTWGETEDYTIRITSGTGCAAQLMALGNTNLCVDQQVELQVAAQGNVQFVSWYVNDRLIPNANGLSLFAVSAGSYRAEVVMDSCTIMTNHVNVDVTMPHQAFVQVNGPLHFELGQTVNTTLSAVPQQQLTLSAGGDSTQFAYRYMQAVNGWNNVPQGAAANFSAQIAMPADSLACGPLPAGSLQGKVALLFRGTCAISDKALNAQRAGAIAVIVVNNARNAIIPNFVTNPLTGDSVTIPVMVISNEDGLQLHEVLVGGLAVQVDFAPAANTQYFYQWFRNNQPEQGANSASYTVNRTGDYSLEVVTGGSCVFRSPFFPVSQSEFGQTPWVLQNLNQPIADITVRNIEPIDANTAWTLEERGAGINFNIWFYRTTNGGQNWTAAQIPNTAGLGTSHIKAIDAQTAFVTLYGDSLRQGVYKTTDGGANWQRLPVFLGGGFPNFTHFWNANTGVAVGDAINGIWQIFRTTNGGTTWSLVSGLPAANTDEFGTVGELSVNQAGEMVWASSGGRFFRSNDQGLTWQWSFTPEMGQARMAWGENGLGVIYFMNSTNLHYTENGGGSWQLMERAYGGLRTITSMSMVPGAQPQAVVVSGPLGTAYAVHNQGWGTIDGIFHSAVKFVSPTVGWSGGRSGAAGQAGIYKWNSTFFGAPAFGSISGQLTYANITQTPMANSTVGIYEATSGNLVRVETTNAAGEFSSTQLAPGNYVLRASTNRQPGGVNATDALRTARHFTSLAPLQSIWLEAADVNGNGTVNSTDALQIAQRFAGLLNNPLGLRIYFDALFGGNLANASAVHMHSGASTDPNQVWQYVVGNWGDPNSPGGMTAQGNGRWMMGMNPVTYYNQAPNGPMPSGSTIHSIGMVFRESGPCSNCLEQKDGSGQDIYVYPTMNPPLSTYLGVKATQSGTNGFAAGNWMFTTAQVQVLGNANHQVSLRGIVMGDVDGSFNPALARIPASVSLVNEGEVKWVGSQQLRIPVRLREGAHLGAMSLAFTYDASRIEALGVEMADANMQANVQVHIADGEIRLSWFDLAGKVFTNEELLFHLQFRYLQGATDALGIALLPESELADVNAQRLAQGVLQLPGAATRIQEGMANALQLKNYPNPFRGETMLDFELTDAAQVEIIITDARGALVRTMSLGELGAGKHAERFDATGIRAGVYFCELRATGAHGAEKAMIRLLIH